MADFYFYSAIVIILCIHLTALWYLHVPVEYKFNNRGNMLFDEIFLNLIVVLVKTFHLCSYIFQPSHTLTAHT